MQTNYLNRTFLKRGLAFKALGVALLSFIATPRIEANPAGDPHFKRGLELSLNRQWAAAEAEYRKAIVLDPKSAIYHSYLADALAAQKKFKQAKTTNQQSATLKKTSPQTNLLTRSHPPARTRTATTKLPPPTTGTTSQTTPRTTLPIPKTSDDGDEQTVTGNGNWNITPGTFTLPDGRKVTVTGEPGQTIFVPPQDKAEDNNNGDEADVINDPHYIKGQEYSDEEKWPQSEAEFRAALKTFPKASEAWDALGDVYFKQGKWKDAETAHRAALGFDPNDDGYLRAQVARDLLKQNRRDEAMKEAKEARRQGLEYHEVFDELGLASAARAE